MKTTAIEVMEALGAFQSVTNYDNKPNQFNLIFENGRVFQSYDSIIVVKLYDDDNYYFGEDWNYSQTTSKYRNMWMRTDTKWCKDKINRGAFKVLDL